MALALAASSVIALGACASPDASTSDEELIGGTDATEAALDAVGRITVYANGREHDICTATLVAPRLVLTATHCFWFSAKEVGPNAQLTFHLPKYGHDARGNSYVAKSESYAIDRTITTGRRGSGMLGVGRDAMLLVLEESVPSDVATPIAVRDRPLDASDEGKTFTTVGYGKGSGATRTKGPVTLDSVQGYPLERAFGTEAAFRAWLAAKLPNGGGADMLYPGHLLSSEADEVHVGLTNGGPAPGEAQTCHGDSGGPLLDTVDGHPVITGVTTGGFDECVLGAVITRIGPEMQDAIARSRAANPPWAWACSGSDNANVCQGATHARCYEDTIHVERCDELGPGFSCVQAGATASCQHSGTGAPPTLDTTPTAVHQILYASGQVCVLGGTGDITCTGPMYRGGKAVVATDMVQMASGAEYMTYGLRKDGAVVRWGGYAIPVVDVQVVPKVEEGLGRFVQIDGTCGLRANGDVECWESVYRTTKVASVPGATRFVRGRNHGCALAGGSVYCWGDNGNGQLGTSTPPASPTAAVRVDGLSDAIALDAGNDATCAVRQDGHVACWGQLPKVCANGLASNCSAPRVPLALDRVTDAVDIRLTREGACVVRNGGLVSCVGAVGYHDAPWEPASASPSPVEMTELEGVSRIDHLGDGYLTSGFCAITKRGHGLACWGDFEILPSIATAPGPLDTIAPFDILGSL